MATRGQLSLAEAGGRRENRDKATGALDCLRADVGGAGQGGHDQSALYEILRELMKTEKDTHLKITNHETTDNKKQACTNAFFLY